MKNIYFVGFMGVGKSLIGRLLSGRLNKEFIEMDEAIEKSAGRSITDIFAQNGEPHFRSLEKEFLKKLALQRDLVVSCGGGLICNDENLSLLKDTGWVICLKASAQTIYQRTKNQEHRPLLNVDSPLSEIDRLLKQREPYYSQAHYVIDTDQNNPDSIVEEILDILENG